MILRCPAGSTGHGLGTAQSTAPSIFDSPGHNNLYNIQVENCATGVEHRGGGRTFINTLTCVNTTTCALVGNGSTLQMTSASFSGVTNELQVDGTNYTYSFFTGLSPKRIVGSHGSSIYQP